MAVACGRDFTVIVTRSGQVWAFGAGDAGQLGLGGRYHQQQPRLVGVGDTLYDPAVMLAAGAEHTVCITRSGILWSWGAGNYGQLGHGVYQSSLFALHIDSSVFGGALVRMVACGANHTMVLTAPGNVWTCGDGQHGQLGCGLSVHQQCTLRPVVMPSDSAGPCNIVMIAAGERFSVALGAAGGVFSWGYAKLGCLGIYAHTDQLFSPRVSEPKHVDRRAFLQGNAPFSGSTAVMIAAGKNHTVAVMSVGRPWVWGVGGDGQLGLGGHEDFYLPQQLALDNAFGDEQVVYATCGDNHTIFLTQAGRVYTCGIGAHRALGHAPNDEFSHVDNTLVPTCIAPEHFADLSIIGASAGNAHTFLVDVYGKVYSFGTAVHHVTAFHLNNVQTLTLIPGGLGHALDTRRFVPLPTRLRLNRDEQVGVFHALALPLTLAFCMGTHPRLNGTEDGSGAPVCSYAAFPSDMLNRIIEACAFCPPLHSGATHFVQRLLGNASRKDDTGPCSLSLQGPLRAQPHN